MPRWDGTGPFGTGPVGRRQGPCGGLSQEFKPDQQVGMGMAHRRGRRSGNWSQPRGWRPNPIDDEMQILQNQQNWLQEQLAAITRRIEELNKPTV